MTEPIEVFVYPLTEEPGGSSIEWTDGIHECSVEISPNGMAAFFETNTRTQSVREVTLVSTPQRPVVAARESANRPVR